MITADNWGRLWDYGRGEVYPVANPTEAKVVHKEERPKDHYGEFMQDDNECYMIIEVVLDGKTRYFKKYGYQSSYGYDTDWSGRLVEVQPVEKTITVWE